MPKDGKWFWDSPTASTRTARRPTAIRPRERPPWPRSPRAGGGSDRAHAVVPVGLIGASSAAFHGLRSSRGVASPDACGRLDRATAPVPRRSSTASPARRCRRAAAACADPGEAGRGGDVDSGRVGRKVTAQENLPGFPMSYSARPATSGLCSRAEKRTSGAPQALAEL